jgi:CRP/FNR family transcriptional regulator, cyclic AMP receptor protein
MAVDPASVARVPLFGDLSPEQIEAAAAKFEERRVDAGRRLTTDGGGGYFFFVIDSGTAEVTHDGAVLATFGPGDFFGESAIFETLRRTATVTTTSPATVLAMFGADFASLTDQIPELRKKIDTAISERLRNDDSA